MIKEIAWDTFKNTGDINSFLEFKQIENLENNMKNVELKNNGENDELTSIVKNEKETNLL